MPRTSLKDILDLVKELRAEDTKFLEKYSEQIGVLKEATKVVNEQKSSWPNRHRWLIITIAVVFVILVAPIVMRRNNYCQFSINLNGAVGFQSCRK